MKHDLHPTDSSGDPDVPSLEGRRVMLVPFHRRHIAFLYSLATDPAIGFRWRLRGGVPSIESFEASLWQAVLCQLIIETKSNQQPVGHVVAYNPNHNSGHCAVAIIMDANPSYKSLGLDGLQVFLGHLFSVYSFRKIYFEVPSYNIGQFRSALGRYLTVEAQLKEHDYFAGQYWDTYVLSLWRPGVRGPENSPRVLLGTGMPPVWHG